MAKVTRGRRALRWIGVLAIFALAFEVYNRFPSSAKVAPLGFTDETRAVVLLFHGTRGRNEPYLTELASEFDRAAETGTTVLKYIWSPYSDNQFRARANGVFIGARLGEELAGLAHLEQIRLVAHSAGAYLLDPLCEAYKAAAANPAHIEMTFIDPIGIKGAWDYGYGYRNHGRCADFAAAYINTDDPVPGTNAPLKYAYNLDVTGADERKLFTQGGHIWPLKYYLDHLSPGDLQSGLKTHAEYPRGRTD
jgi:hypothetical protein